MEEIRKPLGLLRKELSDKLVSAINESQLPLMVVEYVFSEILTNLHTTCMNQEAEEMKQYAEALERLNAETSEAVETVEE